AIDSAFAAVVPESASRAVVDRIRVFWVDENFGEPLGLLETHVRPVLAAVDRFVNAVADRDRVARPALAGTGPDHLCIFWVDRHGAYGLYARLIKDGFEGRTAILRFPNTAARTADIESQPVTVPGSRDGGYAS